MKNFLLMAALVLSFSSNLRGDDDLVVAQFGDSVGSHPFNRTYASAEYPSGITWVGDYVPPYYLPSFARPGWTYLTMLKGGVNFDGLEEHVVNPAYGAPDVVYILGGYNDVAQEPNDSDMLGRFANLQAMLDLIDQEWGSKIFVANITNFPQDRAWAHKQKNVETLNQLIAGEVAGRANAYLVDNNALITDDLVRSDGLHINDKGQELIGRAFGNQLSSVLAPPLFGDANLDGVVNFLDTWPFIVVLSGGEFQAESDCNQDESVSLLDILPFIAILSDQ